MVVVAGNGSSKVTYPRMFRFLLRLPDGQPPDPAVLVTAVPNWSVGDVITVGRGEQLRVVAI